MCHNAGVCFVIAFKLGCKRGIVSGVCSNGRNDIWRVCFSFSFAVAIFHQFFSYNINENRTREKETQELFLLLLKFVSYI